jgi:hypothetical protein
MIVRIREYSVRSPEAGFLRPDRHSCCLLSAPRYNTCEFSFVNAISSSSRL